MQHVFKCSKKGHYGSQCYSKTKSEMSQVYLDSAFLNAMSHHQETSWNTTVRLGKQDITFKMDTGAEVTAISDKCFQQLEGYQLSKPEKSLYGPSRRPLPVVGQFTGAFAHKAKSTTQKVYVIKDLKTNLLGLPTITALDLIARVDTTTSEKQKVFQRFPSVFSGLGNLEEEYEIQLKDNAKPFSLYAPRNFPLPLKDKVQQELDRMESLGVISKVDKLTL